MQVSIPSRSGKFELLENLRGFAAIYVFLCHFFSTGKSHLSLFAFGKEAVFLFFFLSGFVIYHSFERNPRQTFSEYFSKRLLRIYPLFILSLLISWICIGRIGYNTDSNWHTLLGNLFMLQDDILAKPGVFFAPFSGDSPLWSLSYEWWFYMMFFPVIRTLAIHWQRLLISIMAISSFGIYCLIPNQICLFLMYFPIWWSGLELARVLHAENSGKERAFQFVLGTLGAMIVISFLRVLWAYHLHHHLEFGIDPFLELRNFSFCFLCFGFVALSPMSLIKHLLGCLYPFAWAAPISYAIYILHMPLVIKAHYLGFLGIPWLESICYVIVLLVVSVFGETVYQKWSRFLFFSLFKKNRNCGSSRS